MATNTGRGMASYEIIDLMITKLSMVRGKLNNSTHQGRLNSNLMRLSEDIDSLYEEARRIPNNPAPQSLNFGESTLVERSKSLYFPQVVAEHAPARAIQPEVSEGKSKKRSRDDFKEKRQPKKSTKHKGHAKKRSEVQFLLPEKWLSKPIPLVEEIPLRLNDLKTHSELFRRFFASQSAGENDNISEICWDAVMQCDYAKEHYGYKAIIQMGTEKVFIAFRTWNAWLLRGKIEMEPSREARDDAVKLARFLGLTREFVAAVRAFQSAAKISEEH